MKRCLLLVAVVVATLGAFGAGHAADCGVGGSAPNGSGSCKTAGNDVKCGQGTNTGVVIVSASTTGAEVCNEGGTAFPVQGRIGAQQGCDCVYIDGDNDNNHTLLLHGWLRVDKNGASCRSTDSEQGYTAKGRPAQQCFVGGA